MNSKCLKQSSKYKKTFSEIKYGNLSYLRLERVHVHPFELVRAERQAPIVDRIYTVSVH